MVLQVSFEGSTRLDSLGRRLQVATERKMIELTDLLYAKVLENLSGKILEKRTGDLAGSIHRSNDVHGDVYTGDVYVSPATEKAWALEKGGTGYYPIVATKAQMLHFFSKSGEEVFTKSVNHPPSRKFAYLQTALEETAPLVPQGFREYIQAVCDGEDYG